MTKKFPRRFQTSLIVLCALSFVSACGGPEARKAKALEAGKAFLEEGNLDKARVELRNALQIDPNDVEARYLSGVISEEQDNIRRAASQYRAAMDIDATHVPARAALARIHVIAGLPNEAIEIVQEGIADAQPPERAALYAVRGAAMAQLGLQDDAYDDATAAMQDDTSNEQAIALMAGVLSGREELDRAAEVLDTGIATLPESADLRVARALLAERMEDPPAAERFYVEASELYPEEELHYYQLAAFYQRQQMADEAEQVLRSARDNIEDKEQMTLQLIGFLEREKGPAAAERELKAMRDDKEQRLSAGLLLGEFYTRHDRLEEALATYESIIDEAPGSPESYTARARTAGYLITTGQRDEGAKILEDVLVDNPRDAVALRTRAALALSEGRPDDAIVDFRTLVRDDPESLQNHLGLAQAHLQKGEVALGEEALRNAVRAEPNNLGVRVELAEFLARTGRTQAADDLIRSVLMKDATHVAARQTAIRIAASRGLWIDVENRARDLVEISPDSPIGHYYVGMALEGQGLEDSALEAYEAALDIQENGAEPLAAWSRIKARRGLFDEALARIEPLRQATPENGVLANLNAELLVAAGRQEEARPILETAIASDPQSWLLYRSLSRSYAGDETMMTSTIARGFESAGYPISLGVELALMYEQRERYDDAIAAYDKMIEANGTTQILANNLAMLLASYRDDPASLARAVALTEGFANSDNPSLLNTFGWVRARSGDLDLALPILRQAVSQQPDSAVMHYHLGMALYMNGNEVEALERLERALEITDSFPGAEEARATVSQLSSSQTAQDTNS